MKRILSLLALPLVAGCLSEVPPAPVNWTVEWRPKGAAVEQKDTLSLTLRISDVSVRPPYSGSRLTVLRGDGSLAFDAYNVFAAAPDKLLRGAAFDALLGSKRFANVIDHDSQAHADIELEVTVTLLALDCRAEGQRDALVELSVIFLDRTGRVLAVGPGRAAVPVPDGNYSDGFSRAFSQALCGAGDVIAALPPSK